MLRAVNAIFQALCDGAVANPDPDAEDDEGDFFFDEVGMFSVVAVQLSSLLLAGRGTFFTGRLNASLQGDS